MNPKYILLSLLLLFVFTGFSQQEPTLTQFWNVKTYYNPATTGLYYKHQFIGLGKWQLDSVNGRPISHVFAYNAKLNKLHGGLGLTYMHETIGFNTVNKTKLNYSFHHELKNSAKLAFGLSAGLHNLKTEPYWVPPTTTNDNLPIGINATTFTADIGVVYSTPKMNLALSCTQLTESRIGASYLERRHLVLMADYLFGNPERIQIKPQLFVMTDAVKVSFDINTMIYWKEMLGLGFTYRNNNQMAFSFNWDIYKKFRIGYSYDLPYNSFFVSKGSHTVVLGFQIK